MQSVRDLDECAAKHLAHYVDPNGPRAFQAYDRIGNPDALDPTDLLAPALLDAAIPGRTIIAMYGEQGPLVDLRRALEAVIEDTGGRSAEFEDQQLDSMHGPWGRVRSALQTSDQAKGFAAAKVTKILHRKRPLLVPIFDSKVAGFYDVSPRKPWVLWPILQAEIRGHRDWLTSLASDERTPDGRPIPVLRILDIVVWEHVITGCATATR